MQETSLFSFFKTVLKPYRYYMAGLIITGFLFGLQTSLAPYMLKLIIDNLTTGTTSLESLYFWGSLYVLIFFLGAINLRFIDYIRLKLFPALRATIVKTLYVDVQKNSTIYFRDNLTGSIANKISGMSSGFINVISTYDMIFANTCALLIASAILLTISLPLAFVLSFWSILFIALTVRFTIYIQDHAQVFFNSHSHLMGHVNDSLSNIKNIWLFNNSEHEIHKLTHYIDEAKVHDTSLQRTILQLKLMQDVSIFVLMIATMFLLIRGFSLGVISSGDIVFTLMVLRNVIQYIWNLANQWMTFSQETGKCKNALSLIHHDHKGITLSPQTTLENCKGEIHFKDVTFSYTSQSILLNGFNLKIPAKTNIAIVGLSGSGKSTLFKLLVQLYDVQSGEITIDRTNVKHIDRKQLRDLVAIVSPEMGLFNRTIRENIAYGNLGASEEAIIEAAKKAYCHEFVMSLPQQYDTIIGERGQTISSGQIQRIALARAILKDSPIVLLDEAISSLDPFQATQVSMQLKTILKNKTCIIITHQLDLVKDIKKILVFENGRIIESGNHKSLLKHQGLYSKMWHAHHSQENLDTEFS